LSLLEQALKKQVAKARTDAGQSRYKVVSTQNRNVLFLAK